MCTRCDTSLSLTGFVSVLGGQVQEGLTPASGDCGAVAVDGVTLPPPQKKWRDFGDTYGAKRVQIKIGAQKWRVVNPAQWDAGIPRSVEHRKGRAVLVGMAVAGATPAVPDLSLRNGVKAILGRAMRCPAHKPVANIWRFVRRFDHLLLPGFLEGYTPMSVHEWLQSMPSRRRRALEKAAARVDQQGWKESWEWFNAFIKSEKMPGFEKLLGFFTPARTMLDRLIQGPADETHIVAGPLIKPVIKQLKKAWGPRGPIFYASTSVEELNDWFRSHYVGGMVAVMCDYTLFDNSHSADSWFYIESLYHRLGLYKLHPYFASVLNAWRKPKGRVKGKGWSIKYQARVMNASGRDDTSLANALLNGVCFLVSAAAALARKPIFQLTTEDVNLALSRIHLSVCGDDSLCLVDATFSTHELDGFKADLAANISSFGFNAGADKMQVSRDPFDFVYLGMRPYPVSGQWYFCRTIGRAIWKMGWVLDGMGLDGPSRVTGDAVATVTTQAAVPVLSDYAIGYLASREGCKRILPVCDPNKPWTQGVRTPAYDSETLAYVARGYKVGFAELQRLCNTLRERRSFPWVCDDSVLTRMVYHDDL